MKTSDKSRIPFYISWYLISGDTISMNSKSETDEASRGSEASSSRENPTPISLEDQELPGLCTTATPDSGHDIMKRAAAKQLIEKYFYQLLDGCGNPNCDNRYCASSGEARNYTPNEAAAEAIKLFYKEARLCDAQPNKVPRTEATLNPNASTTCNSSEREDNGIMINASQTPSTSLSADISSRREPQTSQKASQEEEKLSHDNGAPLTEESLCRLCDECLATKRPQALRQALMQAFMNPAVLARCFPAASLPPGTEGSAAGSCDPDKDEDSAARPGPGPGPDAAACRRAMTYLAQLPSEYYASSLVTALVGLAAALEAELRARRLSGEAGAALVLAALEAPAHSAPDYLDAALPALARAAGCLSLPGQARLARLWAAECGPALRPLLESLQQLVTLRVVSTTYSRAFPVQDDETVTMATKLMKIVYYASMLGGKLEEGARAEEAAPPAPLDPLGDALGHLYPLPRKAARRDSPTDPLASELGINVLDARRPLVPFDEFYNEPLSDIIEMDKDFANYKTEISMGKKFSFLSYPFVLTPAAKSLGLYYENRIRMYSERRVSLLHAVVGAAPPAPFLRLRVRRHRLIEDALVELEMVAMERALDLKKQLVVEFEGEQGVDEGGVSKEFFQLVVEELFNPDYGMFTLQPDSSTVWFNPTSFESEAQFTLSGIVLGLAIYNNVILNISFPMAVYRKLLGRQGSFEDLADMNPTLYRGLCELLACTSPDLQALYYQTFRVCYLDVYGNALHHDLKEDGDNIFVTQENKHEFVQLYADFLLNTSVRAQFGAFRRGFLMVTDESPLAALFRPEELEMLVCGSKNFDFNELEKSTEYDGGYTAESQTIKDFWSIVHGMSLEEKRKLLQFATGSDRVPVGGLSQLRLVVARHGPDSERLPTAHTCFNVLLLPEYVSKDKLQDRLLKAICYSKGFGML